MKLLNSLLDYAVLLNSLNERFTYVSKGRTSGNPMPNKLPNQRQRRKLKSQNR